MGLHFNTDSGIFLVGLLLLLGVVMTKFSNRLGLPALVFFIAVGMALNEIIYFNNAGLAQMIGILALIMILFEGGFNTQRKHIRKVLASSISLATVGVLLTTGVVGVCAKLILDVGWLQGMLFGAIVSSTDAAAVFAVLGNKNIKRKLTATLEVESGTNDPMAVFLTMSLIELIQHPGGSVGSMLLSFVWEMGFGVVMGIVIGKLAIRWTNKIDLDSSGLYPVMASAFAILAYSATALLHASGLLAVFVMAVIMGNADLTYRHSIVRFHEGFAWMMQILMFIVLGLLVFPEQLMAVSWHGLLLSGLLMLVARPLGVFVSTAFSNFTPLEKVFVSWAGLRGAVPIVLATYPLLADLEHGRLFFNLVFFVVLTSALIQGGTLSPLARKLKLTAPPKPHVPHVLELVSMGKTNSEIIEVRVQAGSGTEGVQLHDITLPEHTLITAIIRGEKLLTPSGDTVLLEGDTLYVLVLKAQRENVKHIFLRDDTGDLAQG